MGDGKVKHLCVPFGKEEAVKLRAGDYVYLSGILYTARDAAHKRMQEALQENGELPFDLENNVIYYMGPSPAREGRPIGSAGPTTASRMDKYTPALLDLGLRGMIGKGKAQRSSHRGHNQKPGCIFCGCGRRRCTAVPVRYFIGDHSL